MRKDHPPTPAHSRIADSRLSHVVPGLALLAVTLFSYWNVVKYPLIQDDWFIADAIARQGSLAYLGSTIADFGGVFYRPLAAVYFILNYSLFGIDSSSFHFITLTIHLLNAYLVGLIATSISSERTHGWIAAVLYCSAATIHLDTLVWMVGIYDLGGMFFFLLSCVCFLNRKTLLSAAAFFAALLMKESTSMTPLVIVALGFLTASLRSAVKGALPHLILLVLFLVVRWIGIAGAFSGESQDYSARFIGDHILSNARVYAAWLSDSLFPILDSRRTPWIAPVVIALIWYAVRKRKELNRRIAVLVAWMICGILPAIILTNHSFRYYLVYSLPGFVILLSIGAGELLRALKVRERASLALLVAVLAANVFVAHTYVADLDRAKFDAPTIDGSNNLLRKGALVMMTREFLVANCSALPHGATLLFDWLPTLSFGGAIGPRHWCADSAMTVYEVKRDERGMSLFDPTQPRIDPPIPPFETGFILRFQGKELDMLRLSDL